jgi:hypothetical protein
MRYKIQIPSGFNLWSDLKSSTEEDDVYVTEYFDTLEEAELEAKDPIWHNETRIVTEDVPEDINLY